RPTRSGVAGFGYMYPRWQAARAWYSALDHLERCFGTSLHRSVDLLIAVGGPQEPRLIARWREIHASLQHGVEEPRVPFVIARSGRRVIGHRGRREEHREQRLDPVDR